MDFTPDSNSIEVSVNKLTIVAKPSKLWAKGIKLFAYAFPGSLTKAIAHLVEIF